MGNQSAEKCDVDEYTIMNLSMFVRRLVRLLRKHDPGSKPAAQAMDYLERYQLQGSPLRSSEAESSKPSAAQIANYLRDLANQIGKHEGSEATRLDLDDAGWLDAAASEIERLTKIKDGLHAALERKQARIDRLENSPSETSELPESSISDRNLFRYLLAETLDCPKCTAGFLRRMKTGDATPPEKVTARNFVGVGELERTGYIPEGSAAEREAVKTNAPHVHTWHPDGYCITCPMQQANTDAPLTNEEMRSMLDAIKPAVPREGSR